MENADFLRKQLIEKNQQKIDNNSREKLSRELIKKITTTMIGALSAFELNFGYLWGHGKDESQLTEEEAIVFHIWNNIRKSILDNGNKQARQMTEHIKEYNVKWKGTGNV